MRTNKISPINSCSKSKYLVRRTSIKVNIDGLHDNENLSYSNVSYIKKHIAHAHAIRAVK